jgi:DNA primase large subunit
MTCVPEYLNKVNSDTKAIACAAILEACRPTHAQRLWLVGFLKYVGYSMPEVMGIIQGYCHWTDYNERVTAYQVGTIFHQRPQRTQNHAAPRPRKWSLSPVEILRIRRQHAINLSKMLCEESMQIAFPHPERLGNFNSWAEFLQK